MGDFDDQEELLFRQVHPTFIRDGRPSGQSFRPMPKDEGKLSVARGAITGAEAAYDLHTKGLGFASAGTWAVTAEECAGQSLPVLADPLTAPPEPIANPAHAVVDFTGVSKSQAEAKASRLARLASERGKLHPPSEPTG